MSKHTPGPWNWDIAECTGCKSWAALLQRGEDDEFPEESFILNHDNAWKMDPANMRLIAAAPDLLEALTTLATWVNGNSSDISCTVPLNKALAAIAKAEGG